jgi:RhtB (resistance to homoserine/threonine) family protein
MFGTHDLPIFIAAVVALVLMPGPDAMYILGRSVTQGAKAGVLSGLGTMAGLVVHISAAALGLSAILATSAHAFTVVKWAGVAYLLYLGIRTFFDKSGFAAPDEQNGKHRSGQALFWQGMLTNLLNPKVALFFMAFLPQFVEPTAPSKVAAFFFLGAFVLVIGLIWKMTLALLSARITRALRKSKGFSRFAHRAMGAILVGLGLRLAQQKL